MTPAASLARTGVPRLLVVAEFSPNASGGGPAVVRQMLKDWPVSDLLWWSCFPDADRRFGQGVQELRCAKIAKRFYPGRKFPALRSFLLEQVWTPYAARHLSRALQELKPEVVWLIPHNWCIPPASRVLGENWPHYHVTVQDYVDVHDNPRRFGVERCARMAAMADRLYAGAATRDATSHPMVADLRVRTGRDAAQMLHAGLEAADFEFLSGKVPHEPTSLRIAYAGTILVEEVFALFASAIESIRTSLGRPVEVHFFGAHSYANRRWFRPEWMIEHGNLAEAELLAKLRQCDWAFSPMALTDHDPRYNRFSFPTKFITYLAAGLPVITLGHPESSVVKTATEYEVGLCTSAREASVLAAQLKTALIIPSPWERYGKQIVRCAREQFDAARMRRTLYECLAKCAARREGGHPASPDSTL